MTKLLRRPTLEGKVYGNIERRLAAVERRKRGTFIYVGTYPTDPNTTYQSVPFQNGWTNLGGDYPPLAFCMGVDGYVRLEGTCNGGLDGTVVFTLPEGYRPDYSQRFPGVVSSGSDMMTIQVDPTGDVIVVSRGYNPGTGGLSEGTIAAGPDGTVLTSEGGVATWKTRAQWLTGAGVPSSGLGVDGDMYLNTSNGDYYQRIAGAWGSPIGNLTGPTGATGSSGAAGAAGSQWLTGTTVPSSGLGVNGDMYLRTTTGDVYQKAAGSWGSVLENLVGPTGATGATGATGPTGPAGADGASGTSADVTIETLSVGGGKVVLSWYSPPWLSSSQSSPSTSNDTAMGAILLRGLPVSKVITGVFFHVGASATSVSGQRLGWFLCDSTGTILASTGNIASSAAGYIGWTKVPFLATYTTDVVNKPMWLVSYKSTWSGAGLTLLTITIPGNSQAASGGWFAAPAPAFLQNTTLGAVPLVGGAAFTLAGDTGHTDSSLWWGGIY